MRLGFETAHRRERLIEARPGEPPVDWPLVVALRRRASERITECDRAELPGPLADPDRRLLGALDRRRRWSASMWRNCDQLARPCGRWHVEQAYARAVENAIFGYGRLQPLFEIPAAENIEIHGCDSVVVQFGDGRREHHPPVADSDAELVEAIRFLGETVTPARPFDDAHPMMTLALGDRFRLHAIGFGLSYRPSVTIRQHTLTDVTCPSWPRAA